MSPILKWALVVIVLGIGLMIWDYVLAKKKKEGFTKGDKQRIVGLFWLTCFASAGVASLIWVAQDL